jgi:hypothetical protein
MAPPVPHQTGQEKFDVQWFRLHARFIPLQRRR